MEGSVSMERYYTTTEFAKAVGVVKNTVVNWERKGLLLPHHVTPTSRRFYSQQQIDDFFKSRGDSNVQIDR